MKKVLLAAAILALVHVGAALALSVIAASNASRHVAALTRFAVLGDTAAARLELVPLADLPPLREACSHLPPVEPGQVLAYFPAAASERVAALPKDTLFPSQAIFGVDAERSEVESVAHPWRASTVLDFFADLLGDAPSTWSWRKERWNEPFNHPIFDTRYLVVHGLAWLEPPRLIGTHRTGSTTPSELRASSFVSLLRLTAYEGYEPGEMSFRSVVLDARSGTLLCAGQSLLAPKGVVPVAASAASVDDAEAAVERKRETELLRSFAFGTYFFALGEACWLGGEELCELTFRKITPAPAVAPREPPATQHRLPGPRR